MTASTPHDSTHTNGVISRTTSTRARPPARMTSDIIVELDNDTIIVATAKVHRQQAITSSFDDDTRVPKSARVAFKLNALETVT
jgi:hypothetical protein